MLSKVNYKIHTDSIKENLIPQVLGKSQTSLIYANEADVLNMALFGTTAKQWRDTNPNEKGNIRDVATIQQLVVLSNLESINAMLIAQVVPQNERLVQLNKLAISQMKLLLTRIGYNSKFFISGDLEQTDRYKDKKQSGLYDALQRFNNVNDIGIYDFRNAKNVRNPLIGKILERYDEENRD